MTFGQRSRGWVRDEQNPKLEEGWRVRVAPPSNTRAAPLGDAQVAASERVRVAPPGSVRAAPHGRVRVAPAEAGPSYRTCTRSRLRRRGVTVPDTTSHSETKAQRDCPHPSNVRAFPLLRGRARQVSLFVTARRTHHSA